MKVTALKDGKFAHPEPSKPQLRMKKGREYDVDRPMFSSLISTGWGAPVLVAPLRTSVTTDAPRSWKPAGFDKMSKTRLEMFAKSQGFDVDTDKSTKELRSEIASEMDARNG